MLVRWWRLAGGNLGAHAAFLATRWRKCRGVLSQLTSTTSGDRPGERGTTGQLIFKKCTEPAASCNCQLIEEPPKPTEPPKPKFPKKYIEFVHEEAMDWLTNLVDID